jgi:hypothetical protein
VVRGDGEKNAELLVLRHENAVLHRDAGRVRYEPGDRAWFAMLTRLIPRRRWAGVFLVTPATLLAWHRMLAAGKYDPSRRGQPGRPATVRSIARLAVRLAQENPLWGYRRTVPASPQQTAAHGRLGQQRSPLGNRRVLADTSFLPGLRCCCLTIYPITPTTPCSQGQRLNYTAFGLKATPIAGKRTSRRPL